LKKRTVKKKRKPSGDVQDLEKKTRHNLVGSNIKLRGKKNILGRGKEKANRLSVENRGVEVSKGSV